MQGLPGKTFMDEMTAVFIYHKQSLCHFTAQTLAKNYYTEYVQNSEWLGKKRPGVGVFCCYFSISNAISLSFLLRKKGFSH